MRFVKSMSNLSWRFSTITLLATVAACGRSSGSKEQQLLELGSKASARLKAQDGSSSDALSRRNSDATERLLRGLIDKEREEREAADKILGDRIEKLSSELGALKVEVKAGFAEAKKRDDQLRADLNSSIDELRKADEALSLRIDVTNSRLEAESKARVDAMKSLTNEFNALIAATDSKTRKELSALIDKVEKKSGEELEKAKSELKAALEKQDTSTRIQLLALSEQILTVRDEAKQSREELEKRMKSDLDNIRGEMVSKMDDLNSALDSTRTELSSKITDGLSSLSTEFTEKLRAAEERMSDTLKNDVAKLRIEIGSLSAELQKVDAKYEQQMADEIAKTQKDLAKLRAEYIALNEEIIKKYEEQTVENQKVATELQKQIVIQESALLASQKEYDARLKEASGEQKALLEAERQAREAELKKLGDDLKALKDGQEEARKKLEAELKEKLSATDDASKAAAEELAQKLRALDETTFATMANLKDAILEERKNTEANLAVAITKVEVKLAEAVAETARVSARVEAVKKAQEDFESYVAQNYATKEELQALEKRVTDLETVTQIMNSDMKKAEERLETLISDEVKQAKMALEERIESVEADVGAVSVLLIDMIANYDEQLSGMREKITQETDTIKKNMASKEDLTSALVSQMASYESLNQALKSELGGKISSLEQNTTSKSEFELLQTQYTEFFKEDEKFKNDLNHELTTLKTGIAANATAAKDAGTLAEQAAKEAAALRTDLNGLIKNVSENYATKADLATAVEEMKKEKQQWLDDAAKAAETMLDGYDEGIQKQFSGVTTDIGKLKTAQNAVQSKLVNAYLEAFAGSNRNLEWDQDMEAFADLVAGDQELILTKKVNQDDGSVELVKGPLVVMLESFVEARRSFLRALQPQQPNKDQPRIEFYDKSFVPLMVACGGNAEASFANAFGRDSFDFLADKFMSGLMFDARGVGDVDELYLKNNRLTNGSSLHHFVLMNAAQTLEGGINDPKCLADIRAWAEETLSSDDFKVHRERISKSADFQGRVAEFVKASNDLQASVNTLESRFADEIFPGKKSIVEAFKALMTDEEGAEIFDADVLVLEIAQSLLAKMAIYLSEGADNTYKIIARQKEFDDMIEVRRQLTDGKDKQDKLEQDISALQEAMKVFDEGGKFPELEKRVDATENATKRALDVIMSLAIRSGDPDLVAASEEAAGYLNYKPVEVSYVKPKVVEIQHFFAAPALKNSTNTCTGESIETGAGVKFWHSQGTTQCWVNFRTIARSDWSSAAGTIKFRVFGAAKSLKVYSEKCGEFGPDTCNATFNFEKGVASTHAGAANVSSKLVGKASDGVFDVTIPGILEPYLKGAASWSGETVYFKADGSKGEEPVTAKHTIQLYSPLVLDFMSVGKPLFSSVSESGVKFDLDGDGRAERTGWIAGYRDVGLLSLDLNGNGKIDNGSELFGEGTVMKATGRKGADGYTALAQHDSNKDGFIDSQDKIFDKLMVWFDRDHNGKSSADELVPVAKTGVSRIGLSYKNLQGEDRFVNGNELRTTAKFWGPQQCGKAGCNSYDVYFSTAFTLSQKK